MHLHSDVGLPWDPSQHRKRLLPILLYCLGFLVVVARTWQGSVMWDALLVVNSIVGFSTRAEGVHFALVLACVWFFEITWQFVCSRLGELIVVFYRKSYLMSLLCFKETMTYS